MAGPVNVITSWASASGMLHHILGARASSGGSLSEVASRLRRRRQMWRQISGSISWKMLGKCWVNVGETLMDVDKIDQIGEMLMNIMDKYVDVTHFCI